ncbi:tetratricopeptide repeat protein [Fluviicola sp.]|jgi:TolA-binding protein|uniref:tetratricopeptide repeat protein n=1 Tax=Fluviicola sp. TaxID=1917219 RepID=UPI00281CACF0|nr:tetratricopeptide repeat protein [Fluviicola sp.]MDR0800996.1 tetratricopeptide repeat protein [Fluviicola sp.]
MKNKDYISRDAFEKLLSDYSEQHSNEHLDEFDRDALEGWKNSGVSFSQMKQLDRKMKFQTSSIAFYITGLAVLVIGILSFLFLKKNPDSPIQRKPLIIKVEHTDIHIPEAIDTLKVIPQKDQITVKEVKLSQNEIKSLSPEVKKEEITDIPFPETVLDPLPPVIEQKPVTVSRQKMAKEIYIQDLKAIDYSQYRSKPAVLIEQYILSGVPANQEDEEAFPQEDTQLQLVNIPYMDYLEKSLKYTNYGKWKQALSRFSEILKTYPDDVNARFYSGWCYYNLGQYNDACLNFSACLQLEFSNFNEEAEWYLAQSRLANGEKSLAKELFLKIKNQKGFYSKQAEKVLKSWK